MRLRVSSESADRIETELLALFFFHDERPLKGTTGLIDWKMNGAISTLIINKISSGKANESTLMPPGKRISGKKILLFGLGDSKKFTSDVLTKTTGALVEQLLKINCKDFCVALPPLKFTNIPPEDEATLLVQGLADNRNADINVTILAEEKDIDKVRKSVEKARKKERIKEREVDIPEATPAKEKVAISSVH